MDGNDGKQQQQTPTGCANCLLSERNWTKEELLTLVGILVMVTLSFIGLAVKHYQLFGRLLFWRRRRESQVDSKMIYS